MPSPRFALYFVLFFSLAAAAQFRTGVAKPDSPVIPVREFCRFDFIGGRLDAAGWAKMKDLTTWKDNPSWRTFRVASRFDQTDVANGFRTARITVKYQLLGRFELGIGYAPLLESENVAFKVKESDGEWHIESTDPDVFEPHISKARAIQWLQEKQKTVTDPGEKASVESALRQLQAK